jgi:hypothetical protein
VAEIAIAKLKNYKSPGSDEIPAELIQGGDEILLCEIHKLIISVWNKQELPNQWKEYQFTKRVTKLTVRLSDITAFNFIQHFIKYPPLKVRSVQR